MVTAGVAFCRPGQNFVLYEILGCLLTIPMAFAMWTGAIGKIRDKQTEVPSNWIEWLKFLLVSTVASAVLLAIDIFICQGHPGISAVFTVGAIVMTIVALPCALRSWILDRLQLNSVE